MKKYKKPVLDIVEFDNLDVMTTSGDKQGDEDSYSDSAIQSYNELSLNQVEISPIPVGVTGTSEPADSESGDPLESIPADENTAENQTDDSTDSTENPADDDGDELAAQTVPEDEVE